MIGTVTLCDTAAGTRTGVEGGDTPHSKEGWGDHQSSSNGALHEEVSVACEDPNNKAAAGVPRHPSMQGSDRSMICHPFRERHSRSRLGGFSAPHGRSPFSTPLLRHSLM